MAGLKKKKQEKNSSPNIVLVIFLVFFFLLTIGLGVWGYYGYAGQDDLKKGRERAEASAKAEKLAKDYFATLYRESRLALGADDLAATEYDQADRKELLSDDFGKFNKEPTKEAARKLIDDIKLNLPGSDKDQYKSDLLKELKAAKEKAKEWEGKADAAVKQNKRVEDFLLAQSKKYGMFEQDIQKEIAKHNEEQLKKVTEKSEAFQKYVKDFEALNAEMEKKKDELQKYKEEQNEVVKNKDREIARLNDDLRKAAVAGGAGQPGGNRGGEIFPLVLDISPGRPLWDYPIGKVISVNMDLREVVINLGSEHGAKPELTFNIFAANTYGRAEKMMKASIEIIKVVDGTSSRCRITSLYDIDGREIVLQGRIRFVEAPLREGDLLYNMFWGTRVAIAGYVNVTGDPSDAPGEQKRQQDDFIRLLQRNGMQVDAYVDMLDGKVVGAISSKTRYLIKGENLSALAAPKGDDKDKEAVPAGGRNAEVNKSSKALRDEALENGLLQISAENFAHVIGYRRARSADSNGPTSSFRPGLPDAGTGRPPAANPDRPEEKKGPEPEKKMP